MGTVGLLGGASMALGVVGDVETLVHAFSVVGRELYHIPPPPPTPHPRFILFCLRFDGVMTRSARSLC